MLQMIECWTADQILPLLPDGELDGKTAAWLEGHCAVCPRHGAPSAVAAFAPDPERQRQALDRILRTWTASPASDGPRAPAWLEDLRQQWRAAPVPMTVLSALSLVIAVFQSRALIP